jgi:hypothetical protein
MRRLAREGCQFYDGRSGFSAFYQDLIFAEQKVSSATKPITSNSLCNSYNNDLFSTSKSYGRDRHIC